MIKEVVTPVSKPGSKVGSNQPKSPGAFSNPSREGGARFDSVPAQPSHAKISLGNNDMLSTVTITGPED